MAGAPGRVSSFILAVSFFLAFGLAGTARCTDIPAAREGAAPVPATAPAAIPTAAPATEAAPPAPAASPAPATPAIKQEEAPAPGAPDTNFPCYTCHSKNEITPWIAKTWLESRHAAAGVKCPECHGNHDAGFDSKEFTPLPGPDRCVRCHPIRVNETLAGRHAGVTKCTSCHPRHTFSLKVARNPEICATCHLSSTHVQGYRHSKMGVVYESQGAGYSATCQTCHMPDTTHNVDTAVKSREVMLKACNRCHSASFAGKVLSEGSFKAHW